MVDRLDRVEGNFREDIKEIRKDVTDIKVSLQDLKSKQHFGMWLIKSSVTIAFGLIGGLLGIHFHSPKFFK